MYSVLYIASVLKEKYRHLYGHGIEEIRLHKLLYFAQKESYIVYGKPLFAEDMEGWIYGPVSVDVRTQFEVIPEASSIDISINEIIDNVLAKYGDYSISLLIKKTHEELPWIHSRNGLLANERGIGIIKKEEIAAYSKDISAISELWGCEYDAFEDAE